MTPTWFKTAAALHRWLVAHHATEKEIFLGLQKKGSTQQGIAYADAIDEALCFGWIDGVRRSVDDERWVIRFTPRKKASIWSQVNLRHMERLEKEGRVQPAGRQAFEARTADRMKVYAFENAPRELDAASEMQFRANKKAWAFFEAQPPGYRRTAIFRVVSAKREETRARRLAELIAGSAEGRRVGDVWIAKKKKR